jgi:hypothetical protein
LIPSVLWLLYDFVPVFQIRIWIRIRMFLVWGTDPRIRIRIRTKMPQTPNIGKTLWRIKLHVLFYSYRQLCVAIGLEYLALQILIH